VGKAIPAGDTVLSGTAMETDRAVRATSLDVLVIGINYAPEPTGIART